MALAMVRFSSEASYIHQYARARHAELLAGDSWVVKSMRLDPGLEFPLKGPRTVESNMRGVVQRTGGICMAAHSRWVVESCVDPTNRSVYEHRTQHSAWLSQSVLHIDRCSPSRVFSRV